MSKTGLRAHFKRSILTGLAALLPLALTIFVLVLCWRFVNQRIARPINTEVKSYLSTESGKEVLRKYLGWTQAEVNAPDFKERLDKRFPHFLGFLVAILVSIAFLYLLGWFLASYVGRKLYSKVEEALFRVPIIKKIYLPTKRVTAFLFGGEDIGRKKASRVVAVQYPYRGVYAMGYVTGEGIEELSRRVGKRMINVFVPTSPLPATGFVLFVPAEEVISLPVTVDETVAFLTTLGVGVPAEREQPKPPEVALQPPVPGSEKRKDREKEGDQGSC